MALFDRAIVDRVARPSRNEPPSITLDTAEIKHLSYLYKLKGKIESAWSYPLGALRLRQTGDLYIRFVILEDGMLGEVRLLRTSGNHMLDEAALQAIRDAAPFLPLPIHWGTKEFAIKGHFIYSLDGYYLR